MSIFYKNIKSNYYFDIKYYNFFKLFYYIFDFNSIYMKYLFIKNKPFIIYLKGSVGSGKTTYIRCFINKFFNNNIIVSPTYKVVDIYHIQNFIFCHFDLYRLKSKIELNNIGFKDYLNNSICFFEWPNIFENILPIPDILINFKNDFEKKKIIFSSYTNYGKLFLKTYYNLIKT